MTDVVIPACNEAGTVGAVVDACVGAGANVIVVANGCTDDTGEVAQRHGAALIVLPDADKGNAMAAGLREVSTEVVLFCDADLSGLTPAHVRGMLTLPPLTGQLVGLTDNPATAVTKYLPPITGQRRLPTAFARRLAFAGSGYEAEIRTDAAVGRAQLPHKAVVLRGVTNPHGTRNPARFLKMAGSVALASAYLLPELLAYERGGLG